MNSEKANYYPFKFLYENKVFYTLWRTLESTGEDGFKMKNGSLIVVSRDTAELRAFSTELDNVHWSEESNIGFDEFWSFIDSYCAGSYVEIATCDLVINAWNFFEDLLRTFKIENKILKNETLDQIYSKFYYDINLEKARDEERTYLPSFSDKEFSAFSEAIKSIWSMLSKHTLSWGAEVKGVESQGR